MSVDYLWQPKGTGRPAGISLKTEHFSDILTSRPAVDFLEVHAENYMTEGGAHHRYLEEICAHYALSVHGVGMSLGSAEGLDPAHVARFKAVVERYRPTIVSEHLAWSVSGGTYLNDLLPLPLTVESLDVVVRNIDTLQQAIGRSVLVENPSSYLSFKSSEIPELEFLVRLAERTGAGLLMDVNNVYVSARNMETSPEEYIDAVPASLIGEVHLAGHAVKNIDGVELRIDDHGSAVSPDVWALYERLITRVGPKPTLVEWDTDIPPLSILVAEAEKAKAVMNALEAAHV
ncbi:MNIO family bufferin maturase [Kordiimonas gwangyangensis]|uniref:MNIO family bufferin maturase n=1 Tax=Kordiimonas gwangyangensis TaxID=288022 RepID=UPI0003618515|nr:DUF692 domain-containing protein [Kordiimonas gwangyangensis]